MSNVGTSLKRRKSDSEDSVLEVASENTAKRQKQENRDTTTTENPAENGNSQETGNGRENRIVAMEDGSESTSTAEFGSSTRDNYFLPAAEITAENIAEHENSEKAENGKDTENIEENNTEEDQNGAETENIAENKNTEEAENVTDTKSIAENKNNEEAKNGTNNETIAENTNSEKSEDDTETKNITEDKNAEVIENGSDSEIITENENPEEAESDSETDNFAHKEGSEIAKSTEKLQVPRGIDKCTSVKEEDLIQRKETLVENVPSWSRTSADYHHSTTDTWHSVSIQRFPEAEPDGDSSKRTIHVYNTAEYLSEDVIKNKFRNSLRRKELFYHGTTRESAISIIEQGINVEKTFRILDFSEGKGFYVTDDYDKACEWSRRKGKMNRTYSKGAVIAFAIDTEMRRNERHLSLMVDSVTNRKFWECIVSHFRRRQTSPDVTRVLKDVKYIEGPVAMIRKRGLAPSEIPTPHDRGQFRQLCICDQGYAKRFGSLTNILCVIFLKD